MENRGKKGENWLQNHLCCPSDPRGKGIDDDDDDNDVQATISSVLSAAQKEADDMLPVNSIVTSTTL